jgi:hypothetical protein
MAKETSDDAPSKAEAQTNESKAAADASMADKDKAAAAARAERPASPERAAFGQNVERPKGDGVEAPDGAASKVTREQAEEKDADKNAAAAKGGVAFSASAPKDTIPKGAADVNADAMPGKAPAGVPSTPVDAALDAPSQKPLDAGLDPSAAGAAKRPAVPDVADPGAAPDSAAKAPLDDSLIRDGGAKAPANASAKPGADQAGADEAGEPDSPPKFVASDALTPPSPSPAEAEAEAAKLDDATLQDMAKKLLEKLQAAAAKGAGLE